ncbi:tRNA (adenosine(37)-N6)-threonylcarbamoyltransferase complex ATPase subunit type 1 TsaE [Litoreibacter arenae]|uniref:tRNA threonylcarbamoyladenosine biosynthesis protein TsaE n=1 Tax=Litoreibacter arenae DSM 19593 TaxID=1123360 RepID=S9QBR1_9RHOB|nr:tRNA (adenosine(37)-N6)-threonylcarbamoyltransferase complex ATPase subunit type 1 TsaE [Litoreibacter arenae]EPX77402.1 ATPase YjeE, predicted to have essential role in cell wall biosynthesis [Litoreibacter arenae DSM 19593]
MTSPAPAPNEASAEQSELTVQLRDTDDTSTMARAFADLAMPGLCILLEGPVGAGKSFFARSVIQNLMARHGGVEDVPSPTFTLVQTYDLGPLEVWHADLYRLTNPDELIELGLDQAFETALCLIEWPDRLGGLHPKGAVTLNLTPDPQNPDRRSARISGPETLVARLRRATESLSR